jgi:tetratricopeptide (TPR) repeat protein
MSCADDSDPLRASLGTCFENDRERDTVRITAADGTEIEVPGPDLRECLSWLSTGAPSSAAGPYGKLLDRSRARLVEMEIRVQREERNARQDLVELLGQAPGERQSKVAADERLRTYSLARRAAEQSRATVLHDPALALELAALGRGIAAQLDPRTYGGPQVRHLQAYAEAVFGNALRVTGDLRGAAGAFALAREYLDLGGDEPSEALEVDDLESSLCRSLRDYRRALELSARVVEGNLELGQTDASARALQKRSIILQEMGEIEEAINVLQNAAELAADSSDSFLVFRIRHGLAICLARIDRIEEAGALLEENRGLYQRLSSPKVDGCRLWLEGLVALGKNDLAAAADALGRSRAVFEEHGFPYDTAQVSLDLAAALAGLGRTAEVRELAAATYAFMESREVHPDALAALAVFRQAAAREELSRELLRGLAQRLGRASALAPPLAS